MSMCIYQITDLKRVMHSNCSWQHMPCCIFRKRKANSPSVRMDQFE